MTRQPFKVALKIVSFGDDPALWLEVTVEHPEWEHPAATRIGPFDTKAEAFAAARDLSAAIEQQAAKIGTVLRLPSMN